MLQKVVEFISFKIVSPFNWARLKFLFTGRAYDLTPEDREHARGLMKICPCVWVSRRETHLTTYFIGFSDFALMSFVWIKSGFKGPRPKFGFYSHAFINLDENEIVEAVAKGVQKHLFDDVFDCDAIAALRPRALTNAEWIALGPQIREGLSEQIGKKYDALFDISDDSRVSCIECVRVVLKKEVPLYDLKFKNFEAMISNYKNVTPQMLIDSGDFEIVWEVKK